MLGTYRVKVFVEELVACARIALRLVTGQRENHARKIRLLLPAPVGCGLLAWASSCQLALPACELVEAGDLVLAGHVVARI